MHTQAIATPAPAKRCASLQAVAAPTSSPLRASRSATGPLDARAAPLRSPPARGWSPLPRPHPRRCAGPCAFGRPGGLSGPLEAGRAHDTIALVPAPRPARAPGRPSLPLLLRAARCYLRKIKNIRLAGRYRGQRAGPRLPSRGRTTAVRPPAVPSLPAERDPWPSCMSFAASTCPSGPDLDLLSLVCSKTAPTRLQQANDSVERL